MPKDLPLTIGATVKQARQSARLSQEQLAKAVGVTQVTVSRLERDLPVRPKIITAVFEFLRPHIPLNANRFPVTAASVARQFVPKVFSTRLWDISYFRYSPSGFSGDIVSIAEQGKQNFAFLICDAAGTGPDANVLASALDFSFHALAKAITPDFFHPEGVRRSIEHAYVRSTDRWQGPPSLAIGTFDDTVGFLEVLNLGMPTPLARTNQKKASPYLLQEQALSALGADANPPLSKARKILTESGDCFLFFSDGFEEAFVLANKDARESLKDRFMETSKLLAGDGKAILLNLIQGRRDGPNLTAVAEDDACALVLARKRE